MLSQLGYGRAIIRYAMDALVFVLIISGMLFFLFETFDDKVLSFAIFIFSQVFSYII